jgi:beta-galactosidase
LQNEWMYWEDHGWNEEIKTEYSDWVWSDGNHPSIVIWDALNENRNTYIGSELIPQLRQLDPTRIWDAGYMAGNDMQGDEMDEPHPYMSYELRWWDGTKEPKEPYQLGNLDFNYNMVTEAVRASQAQLVNEYGWVWTWRDGQPSKLTRNFYRYYLGNDSSLQATRSFQAYWLEIDTEWLRSKRALAGVLAFTHLTNNYGYTGDWFSDIIHLTPTPALQWFRHCFAPAAVFINLMDERYVKQAIPHQPKEQLAFNLVGINDYNEKVKGGVVLKLYNDQGKVVKQQNIPVTIEALEKNYIPVTFTLPAQQGGYTLVAEFMKAGSLSSDTVMSRRYLKIGKQASYRFFEPEPGSVNE